MVSPKSIEELTTNLSAKEALSTTAYLYMLWMMDEAIQRDELEELMSYETVARALES
jgi:hypothetical protein